MWALSIYIYILFPGLRRVFSINVWLWISLDVLDFWSDEHFHLCRSSVDLHPLKYIVDMGGFGHLRDFCNFWTRELHLNSSYGLGILRQPFRTMSCRKCGSKINVGMSGIFLKFVIFLASKKFSGKIRTPLICRMTPPALYLKCNRQLIMLFNGQSCTLWVSKTPFRPFLGVRNYPNF